jgi:methyltransferase-like protein 6
MLLLRRGRRLIHMSAASGGRTYYASDFEHSALDEDETAYISRIALHAEGASARAARARAAALEAAVRWGRFYDAHGPRVYKPRYYLTSAFPALLTVKTIIELGAGAGSNIIPLLERTTARVFASDVTAAALRSLSVHDVAQAALSSGRLSLHVFDVVRGGDASGEDGPYSAPLPTDVEAVLLTFTASAAPPEQHASMFHNCAALLKRGGILCFRDHAARDLAQLRAPVERVLTPSLHEKGDGTLAYFFTVEEVRLLLESSGFLVRELSYATVINRNRKTGAAMHRVFIHALAEKR